MSIRLSRTRVIAVVIAVIVIAIGGAAAVARLWPVQSHRQITVDYPREGALFPPDFAPPTLEWRDASQNAEVWTIDVGVSGGDAASLHVTSRGEPATDRGHRSGSDRLVESASHALAGARHGAHLEA